MGKEGVILNIGTRDWWFGKSTVMDPLEFAREVLQENQPAYIAHLSAIRPKKGVRKHKASNPNPGPLDPSNPGLLDPDDLWKLPGKTKCAKELLDCLRDFQDIASEDLAKEPLLFPGAEHSIDLLPGTEPPYGPF